MRLNEIYDAYKDDVAFLVVYIQEAHPEGDNQSQANYVDDVVYEQPVTEDDRAEIAQTCMLRLELRIPTVLDHMNNETDTAYAALPERLYVVDRDGKIAYRGEMGPSGFDPEEWLLAIDMQVESAASQAAQ